MPFTALSMMRPGKVFFMTSARTSTMLPGWVVVRRYILVVPFLPVNTALAALITTTWSPMSRKGVQVGLFLPESTSATTVLRRPTGQSGGVHHEPLAGDLVRAFGEIGAHGQTPKLP